MDGAATKTAYASTLSQFLRRIVLNHIGHRSPQENPRGTCLRKAWTLGPSPSRPCIDDVRCDKAIQMVPSRKATLCAGIVEAFHINRSQVVELPEPSRREY